MLSLPRGFSVLAVRSASASIASASIASAAASASASAAASASIRAISTATVTARRAVAASQSQSQSASVVARSSPTVSAVRPFSSSLGRVAYSKDAKDAKDSKDAGKDGKNGKDSKDAGKDGKDGKEKKKEVSLPPGTTSDLSRNLSNRLKEGFDDKEYKQNVEEFQAGMRPIMEPIGKAAQQAKSIAVATAQSVPVQAVVGGIKATANVAGKVANAVVDQIPTDHPIVQGLTDTASFVKREIIDTAHNSTRPYRPPAKVKVLTPEEEEAAAAQADPTKTAVVVHQGFRWQKEWKNFKDSNPIMVKLQAARQRFGESDNAIIRVLSNVSDSISNIFSPSEIGMVIGEINRVDPNFNVDEFTIDCEKQIIPILMEAVFKSDLKALEQWCHEVCFRRLLEPIKSRRALGVQLEHKVMELNGVELRTAQLMEQGPTLVFIFNMQYTRVLRNSSSEIIEGDPDQILAATYAMALTRDLNVYDTHASWRVIDLGLVHERKSF